LEKESRDGRGGVRELVSGASDNYHYEMSGLNRKTEKRNCVTGRKRIGRAANAFTDQ